MQTGEHWTWIESQMNDWLCLHQWRHTHGFHASKTGVPLSDASCDAIARSQLYNHLRVNSLLRSYCRTIKALLTSQKTLPIINRQSISISGILLFDTHFTPAKSPSIVFLQWRILPTFSLSHWKLSNINAMLCSWGYADIPVWRNQIISPLRRSLQLVGCVAHLPFLSIHHHSPLYCNPLSNASVLLQCAPKPLHSRRARSFAQILSNIPSHNA
jgi:hypothetical protein